MSLEHLGNDFYFQIVPKLESVQSFVQRCVLIPQNVKLTLKAPRKTASENVVCLCRLLNILANFSNLFFANPANSVDPDQTAPKGAV